MPIDPWYRVVTPREEVREGRSFSPDEFAIALEQVIAETAPVDYRDPAQFFSRTCFTRPLKKYAEMVLRRLSGETGNTAPVLTLITELGVGAENHVRAGAEAKDLRHRPTPGGRLPLTVLASDSTSARE